MIPHRRFQIRFVEWGVFGVFGAALVLLAFPGILAEYYRLEAAPGIRAITENTRSVSESEISNADENLANASFYTPRNRTLSNNRATAQLKLYEFYKTKAQSDKALSALSRAQDRLLQALKAAPGDANLWYLLAETRVRLQGVDAKAVDFLRLSYLSGPREGWVSRRRLGLSLRLWPMLDGEIRKMTQREISSLWFARSYRRDVARLYHQATQTGREAIVFVISKMGEKEKLRLLDLVKHLY